MSATRPNARFFDGQSALPHPAAVAVRDGYFEITFVAGESGEAQPPQLWPAADIRFVDAADRGMSKTFTNLTLPMSRLVMNQVEEARVLGRRLGIDQHDAAFMRISPRILALWSLPALTVAALVFFGIPLVSAKIAPHLPYDARYEFGRYVVRALAGDQERCIGQGRRALYAMTDRLVTAAGHREKVHVEVTESKVVNAFAAPGGSIIIFQGLIDAVQSPEELAGVLAHEIGHVVKEHPTDATMRALGFSLALTVMFGGADAGMASAAVMVHSLSYNRRAEREADEIGATLLEKINVDPAALKAFFVRMQKKEGQKKDSDEGEGVFGYFSTHPAWPERIAAIETHSAPANVIPLLDAEAWAEVKAVCKSKPLPPANAEDEEEAYASSEEDSEDAAADNVPNTSDAPETSNE